MSNDVYKFSMGHGADQTSLLHMLSGTGTRAGRPDQWKLLGIALTGLQLALWYVRAERALGGARLGHNIHWFASKSVKFTTNTGQLLKIHTESGYNLMRLG